MPRSYFTAGIVFCLVCFACEAAFPAEPKRILIIDSFGRDFAPWNEYAKRFRADLDRQWSEPMDLYETSLAFPRFSGESKESESKEGQFIEYVNSLFVDRPLDLIVTIGAPAAQFAQRNRQKLFPTVPLLLGILDSDGFRQRASQRMILLSLPRLIKMLWSRTFCECGRKRPMWPW